MNDYRGLLIKKQRKALDISLEALSHGVCSPSYLSKIENNILVANDDIYNLLFKKLGISTMDTIKEEKIKQDDTTSSLYSNNSSITLNIFESDDI